MHKRFWTTMILLASLLVAHLPTIMAAPLAAPLAQAANLVTNGGFESGSAPWLPWWSEKAKPNDGTLNYAAKPNTFDVLSLSAGTGQAGQVLAGDKAYRIHNSWDPWFAGVKQTVTAPAGATVRLTASGRIWALEGSWPSPSDGTVNGVSRVGIEPNGSGDQFVSGVVWSGGGSPHSGWQTFSVDAVVGASGKVTVILSTDYRGYSRLYMVAFWDEVSLVVVNAPAPGNTPAPGPQPTSGPVATRAPAVLPTPGPDGNIIYVVQEGDTLWGIAFLASKTVDEIKALNGLTSDIISVGQRLIIGQGQPSVAPTATLDPNAPTAAPTEEPSPTAAVVAPTETVPVAAGKICVLIWDDANGNGFRDGAESQSLIAGGQLAVLEAATGQPVQVYTTDGVNEPHCFENLSAGQYTISAAPPSDYNLTSESSKALQVEAGQTFSLEFGAQPGSGTPTADPAADSGRLRTALLGSVGVVLLLLAAGIAGFFFMRRR